jgi:hypothetical protein
VVSRMSTIMLTAGRACSLAPVSSKSHRITSQERSCTWRRWPVNALGFSSARTGKIALVGGVYGKKSHICWCQKVPAEEEEEVDVSEADMASGVGSSSQVSGCKSFTLACCDSRKHRFL